MWEAVYFDHNEEKIRQLVDIAAEIGVERVVQGDFTLEDWTPAFSLTGGALPKEAVEQQFPHRGNNRGLFAATRFESTRDGSATFRVQGDVKGLWVNGTIARPGADGVVRAPVKRGVNAFVLQLNDVTPGDVTLRSADVTFLME